MRPAALNPLFAGVGALPGVGPKTAALFDRLLAPEGVEAARVLDLLFHVPHGFIDRRARPKVRDATPGEVVTLDVTVAEHRPPPTRHSRAPYKVIVEDDTGDVELVFFLANRGWIEKMLPLGARRWISGVIELWDGHRQMVHPDRVMDEGELARLPPVEPVYGLTEGLHQRVVAKAAQAAVARLPDLPEWHEERFLAARALPSLTQALRALHLPREPADIAPDSRARLRLACDELLAGQLALAMTRARLRDKDGRSSLGDGRIASRIEAALPFSLTRSQSEAIDDIRADLAAPQRMVRLVQGDVGAGKTLVALFAMAQVVEAGRQAAMMAPTELLARQHHDRLKPLCDAAGLRIALLTGRDRSAARARTLAALAAGEIDIAFGTHALFQEAVAFRDMALAVVDEQHRFGVHQRLALGEKGGAVDFLVMTATPIPRTLVLTYFGDMDVSTLREKPAGRTPIDTRALPLDRIDEVVSAIGRAIAGGARVYWVCPLVEESETLDVAAAQERFESLQQIFGDRVGLLHGRMKGAEKDAAMAAFQRGDTQILVATTVIEVGVDVPEATVMIIEHAERFGLAQLHQLRGRVGRGAARSTCLLLYRGGAGETAMARIDMMRQSDDGFRIAEEDLRLRGEGDVLGARQSGAPGFRFVSPEHHGGLIEAAREEARSILSRDPQLSGPRGEALRMLLYLFGKDDAARLIGSG